MNCPYCGNPTVRETNLNILSLLLYGEVRTRFCPQCNKKWKARRGKVRLLGRDLIFILLFTGISLVAIHWISSLDFKGGGKGGNNLLTGQSLEGLKKKFKMQSRASGLSQAQKAEALKAFQQFKR